MQHYVNIICEKDVDAISKLDESIFPNTENTVSDQDVQIITIPLSRELSANEADEYAQKLANYLVENGLDDFDIEISSSDEYIPEETYDGNDFHEEYGIMHFNQDDVFDEAEYRGRKVSLGKPTRGDVKKFKVYVRKPNGNIVKVNFGDPNMRIKKSNPKRRKSFRARHNCDNPGPRHKARYWSCRKW
tara:strand:- start:1650 stop:2213 length:564 start_codon:yes stop_codon:yes gene_type:complete